MSRVRVGINLLWLAPGEVGGSEDYCIGLIRALAREHQCRHDVDVVLYLNRELDATYPDLRQSFDSRIAPIDGRSRLTRIIAENTWLARATRRDRDEVVHHLGGTMPVVRGAPGIVLVHDLQPWALPENFSRAKRLYLHAVVPRSLRRAVAVTTLSRWVQQDVHERLGVPLSRMVCLPPGAERLVAEGARDANNGEDDDAVLARYGLTDRPFFLYPVITYAHKNHATLLRAFARVVSHHPDVVLVLTGGEGPAEVDVQRAINQAGLRDRVRRLGRVSNPELDVLYRETTALTFPSTYEGFGMPVLEVMSFGRPVVAASAGALPEVVGDGGLLLDATDDRAWAAALDELLVDEGRWAALSSAATARAASFSWADTVRALVELYRRCARGANASAEGSA